MHISENIKQLAADAVRLFGSYLEAVKNADAVVYGVSNVARELYANPNPDAFSREALALIAMESRNLLKHTASRGMYRACEELAERADLIRSRI